MPISRVRSVTVASMMFMMPMPPTTSEMPAIATMHEVPDALLLLGGAKDLDRGLHVHIAEILVRNINHVLGDPGQPLHVIDAVALEPDFRQLNLFALHRSCLPANN